MLWGARFRPLSTALKGQATPEGASELPAQILSRCEDPSFAGRALRLVERLLRLIQAHRAPMQGIPRQISTFLLQETSGS